jgi:DNA modification methylase
MAKSPAERDGVLYYGDNLDVLRRYVDDGSVDLVYLDPPFNSKKDYNVLFHESDGSRAAAQVRAFKDTWEWDTAAAAAYYSVVEEGGKLSQAMQAFRLVLGQSDMLAYLSMMAPRLIELHRVMKPTASIYLHCDPVASHYLKILLDAVFRPENFRNEIIWRYRRWPTVSRQFQKMHDVLLFYSRTTSQYRTFSTLYGYEQLAESTLRTFGTKKQRADFSSGHRKPGLEDEDSKGPPLSDVWEIGIIPPSGRERMGYPTQKPEKLLERVISASSKKGEVVLDPFCGCGTAVAVAHRLQRSWIGIDITHLAINLIKQRMRAAFAYEAKVVGEPVSLPDAQTLAAANPYQFQWWALGLVGARPVVENRGADEGIDGRLFFHDEGGRVGTTKQVVFSVKSGRVGVGDMRDLRGVVEREGAQLGALITLDPPTPQMRAEAASAGFYTAPGWGPQYPKLQILTVEELLAGAQLRFPAEQAVNVTFKRSPRSPATPGEQLPMPYARATVAKGVAKAGTAKRRTGRRSSR